KDGDTVVEISTDKVDMELPAPASGKITEILAQDGETVTVGQVIARMTVGALSPSDGAPSKSAGAPSPSAAPDSGASEGVGSLGSAATAEPATPSEPGDGGTVSPVARRIAASEGIDLSKVHGTAR